MTGAFRPSYRDLISLAGITPLPPAVLMHATHDAERYPIGIGIPRFDRTELVVDAVLGTFAQTAWSRVVNRQVSVSSIVVYPVDRAVRHERNVKAFQGRAWVALGYESWDSYCDAEFDGGRLQLPREQRREVVASLAEAGMSTRAIAAATGMSHMTAARDLAGVTSVTPDVDPVTGAAYLTPADPIAVEPDDAEGCAPESEQTPGQQMLTALDDYPAAITTDDEIVDAEIVDEPPRVVTGVDGKSYPVKARAVTDRKPPRKPVGAVVQTLGLEMVALAERAAKTLADDRVTPADLAPLTTPLQQLAAALAPLARLCPGSNEAAA